ncbi:MAG: OadG family protein [Kiritimatiellae bacterium]|nr:OadG family protein [Kiritimatiellia bacterium]
MIAGMGIVYFFLSLHIVVTKLTMGAVARFDAIQPQDAPKKKPAAAAADDDANVALAIAVALKG